MTTQPSATELAHASGAAPTSARLLQVSRWLAKWEKFRGPLSFALAFAFLNASMNDRYPARQPALWYLVPSLDVVGVFIAFALCGAWRKPIPRAAHGSLVGFFLISRVLRVADGIEMGAYYRNFNTVVDFPLIPEFARLFYTTVPHAVFVLACFALVCSLGALGFLLHRALGVAERALASPLYVKAFAILVGIFALASPFEWQAPQDRGSPFKIEDDRRLAGAFGSSIFSRVATELDFAANISGYKVDKISGIARVQKELGTSPHDLKKLGGKNVYIFIIESYGQCVLDRPTLSALVLPEYERFERYLSEKGFGIASRVLDSSTYGGRSWLAHATLSTGVRTVDQFQLELLRVAQPKTLAQAFGDAGYRTVLVQPGTSYGSPLKDFHHFRNHYFGGDFGYAGPRFGWSPMPDQLMLDVVRRNETSHLSQPAFIEYALTSSHAPWSDLPPIIEDWSLLGDGSLYKQQRGTHYPTGWLALGGAGKAYAGSIVYDLEVLRRYTGRFITDDSLVIVLGDHQPHSEVTDQSAAVGVPVHVLSRNPAFIDPFRTRGYTAGMVAKTAGPHPGLETFMTHFIADFSLDKAPGAN